MIICQRMQGWLFVSGEFTGTPVSKFGYFGKTIHSVRAMQYNLPLLFVNVWSDWLESVLAASEYDLAETWADKYREASRYYFAISAGIAGTRGWIGVMAPSTDAFGRRYPFCFAMPVPESVRPFCALRRFEGVLHSANALMDDLLHEDFAYDSLTDRVDALTVASPGATIECAHRVISGKPCADETVSIHVDQSVFQGSDTTTAMLDALLGELYSQYSLWTRPPDSADSSTLLVAGLPGVQQGVALFDNQWGGRGCTVISNIIGRGDR